VKEIYAGTTDESPARRLIRDIWVSAEASMIAESYADLPREFLRDLAVFFMSENTGVEFTSPLENTDGQEYLEEEKVIAVEKVKVEDKVDDSHGRTLFHFPASNGDTNVPASNRDTNVPKKEVKRLPNGKAMKTPKSLVDRTRKSSGTPETSPRSGHE
jgi:hypothetical protein